MADDFTGLYEWLKQQTTKLPTPPKMSDIPSIGEAARGVAELPAVRSLKLASQEILAHPNETIQTISHHITPSDTIPPTYDRAWDDPVLSQFRQKTLGMSPPKEESSTLMKRVLQNSLPEAVQKTFIDEQQKGKASQIDSAGRKVVGDDVTTLWPAAKAAGRAAWDLSPGPNIMNVLRGYRVDEQTGQNVPLSGQDVIGEMEDIGLKGSILSHTPLKMPNLEEALIGPERANLDPVVDKTKFRGEIEGAVRARKLNEIEAASTAADVERLRKLHGADEDIAAGSVPIPLDERGKLASQLLPSKFPRIDRMVASGVARAQEFAGPSAEVHKPTQAIDPRWDAMHKGILEGMPTADANREINRMWENDPDQPIPGRSSISIHDGESPANFQDRVFSAFDEELAKSEANPEAVHTVFTHSDVLKALQARNEAALVIGEVPNRIRPSQMDAQTSGRPGTIYRVGRNEDGIPELFDVSKPGAESGGLYLIRHGETAWDPKGESNANATIGRGLTPTDQPNSGIASPPRSLQVIQDLRDRLPDYKQDAYLEQLPKVSWLQQRAADWVSTPAALEYMKNYDPANKAADPVHEAMGNWYADPRATSQYLNDLQEGWNLSPQEARELTSKEIDNSARYAGQANKVFSDSINNFRDQMVGDAINAKTVAQAAEADKVIRIVEDYKKRLANQGAGVWAKGRNVLQNVEDLSRAFLTATLETTINISKGHGLISLGGGIDAMNSSLVSLVSNSGRNIARAMIDGKMPEKPVAPNFRQDMGDAMGFFNAVAARTPFVADEVAGRVHRDPGVYGITPETYNQIQSDAANGMPILPKRGEAGTSLAEKYADILHPDLSRRVKQLNDIVNGQTHRSASADLLNASPMAAGRILGGYVFDADSSVVGHQVNLMAKALEQAHDTYANHPDPEVAGQIGRLKDAWASGVSGMEQAIKALPFEAMWGKGGFQENLKAAGANTFEAAKMGVDFMHIGNRLINYELGRFQYHMNFVQELNRLGMTEDSALAAMQDDSVVRDPETGLWQPKPVDPRLREAAARAEIAAKKNTLTFEPKAGILGVALQAMRTFGQKVFPTTTFGITFPRYVANYMTYIASHSPTKLLDLFSQDFRSKLMDVTGEDPEGRAAATRSLGRGLTGLALTSMAYAMSQGHKIGGYTMGPKPYQLTDGSVDENGQPKYLNVDTVGPMSFYLHLGHVTDALVNQKPINLTAEEWQDFLSGAKFTDAPLFGLHDTVQNLQSENPDTLATAMLRTPGQWLGRWTRFWKGAQEDAAAVGANLPNRMQNVDLKNYPLTGPTRQNVAPQTVPARVNPFTGRLDIEEHPLEKIFKSEKRPMHPMERWMTEEGEEPYKVSPDVGDAVANNNLRLLTGAYLNDRNASRYIVSEATGIDMPIEDLVPRLEAAYPEKGPQSEYNRQIRQMVLKNVLTELHKNVKDDFEEFEAKRVAAGQPSPYLANKAIKEEDQGLPFLKEEMQRALHAAGIR